MHKQPTEQWLIRLRELVDGLGFEEPLKVANKETADLIMLLNSKINFLQGFVESFFNDEEKKI